MTTIETLTQTRDDAKAALIRAYDALHAGVCGVSIGKQEKDYTAACEALAQAELETEPTASQSFYAQGHVMSLSEL
jgi:hypothetical protein